MFIMCNLLLRYPLECYRSDRSKPLRLPSSAYSASTPVPTGVTSC